MFNFSHYQCQRCHNFKNFWQHTEILWEKRNFINLFICLALTGLPIRIGMPWMPIRIQIRQNDADPTRSGSTTLESVSPNRKGPDTPYFDAGSIFLTGARHKWYYFSTWNWIHCLTRACSIGEVPQIEGFVWKIDRRLPSNARAKTFSFKS